MVSYPESVDRTAPSTQHLPPPPSSSSRLSHSSRHRRHGRSHQGGSSYQPQNEFPVFAHTGDVEIVITAEGQEKRYLLHRLILAQCSGFFEASTSEEWSRVQAQKEIQAAAGSSGSDHSLPSIPEDGSGSVDPGRRNMLGSLTKKRWRYELDWENREEDEEPILVQKVCQNSRSQIAAHRYDCASDADHVVCSLQALKASSEEEIFRVLPRLR